MAKSLADLRKMPRNQLNKVTKEDIIDCILSSSASEEVALNTLTEKLNAVNELVDFKRIFTSPDSDVNKKFSELQQQIDKQSEVISKQQQFLETIDHKERENNVVILRVPDKNEALDGAVTVSRSDIAPYSVYRFRNCACVDNNPGRYTHKRHIRRAKISSVLTGSRLDHKRKRQQRLSDHKGKRQQRLEIFKTKCDRIISYITTESHLPGLSKSEQRSVRNQAKTHVWDDKKQELYYTGGKDLKKKVVTDIGDVIDILKMYHSNPIGGHTGINNTLAKISSKYSWHGMKEDIVEYVSSCDRCQHYDKIKTQASVLHPISVEEPLELVGMDLIGPLPTTTEGNKYVLTFTDYFTKFVDFFPLKIKQADGVAQGIKTFVCRWGAPQRLLSDQGQEFVAKINEEVCRKFDIKLSVTSAYHPQTNDLDERTDQALKQRFSKLVNDHQDNWDSFLDDVAFSIRTQKQSSTKFTPYFLMFGRHPRTPRELSNHCMGSCTPGVLTPELNKQMESADIPQIALEMKINSATNLQTEKVGEVAPDVGDDDVDDMVIQKQQLMESTKEQMC